MTGFVVDTHIHLSTDDFTRYPRAEKPPFETADYLNPVELYLGLMSDAGVASATIVQPFGLYGSDNSYHADAAQAHPYRLRAVCGLSPSPSAAEDLRYWVGERGMSGLRVNTRGEKAGLQDHNVPAMLEQAQALGVPVTIMMSHRHIDNAYSLARRFPRLCIALDHLGGAKPAVEGSFERLALLAEAGNIYLKVSTRQILEPGGVEQISALVDDFGDRIVWGSNYPITDHGGYAATVDASRQALSALRPARRDSILGGAALKLWPELAASQPSQDKEQG